ncbi:MAG: hypothetical protein ACFFAH_02150 [Promethearchaeota archaeon]
MTPSDGSKQEEIIKILKNIDSKMNDFSEILQKFGLDIITQFGKTTHNIRVLIDKIDGLDKATITIKGLAPQLTKIIDNQDILESEIDLIKSLIQRSNIISKNEITSEEIERDQSITEKKEFIIKQLNKLSDKLNKIDDLQIIIADLETIKQEIFESLGGHKIPYEISKIINKLNNKKALTNYIKEDLAEKIVFWINRL